MLVFPSGCGKVVEVIEVVEVCTVMCHVSRYFSA